MRACIRADAGLNVHAFSRSHIDLFFSGTANYMPGIGAILPAVNFSVRGYFGAAARVGVSGMIGVAMCTVNRELTAMGTTLRYRPGQFMLTYAIGVPIKIRRDIVVGPDVDRFR